MARRAGPLLRHGGCPVAGLAGAGPLPPTKRPNPPAFLLHQLPAGGGNRHTECVKACRRLCVRLLALRKSLRMDEPSSDPSGPDIHERLDRSLLLGVVLVVLLLVGSAIVSAYNVQRLPVSIRHGRSHPPVDRHARVGDGNGSGGRGGPARLPDHRRRGLLCPVPPGTSQGRRPRPAGRPAHRRQSRTAGPPAVAPAADRHPTQPALRHGQNPRRPRLRCRPGCRRHGSRQTRHGCPPRRHRRNAKRRTPTAD